MPWSWWKKKHNQPPPLSEAEVELGRHIVHVASAVEDPEEFARRAQEAAATLGPRALEAKPMKRKKGTSLAWRLDKPSELAEKCTGIGAWAAVCQEAIFEIWFHLGEAALRDLRYVAFGEYDWTQARATDVLCRLALNGIETKRTADDIADSLPDWRYEQVMRVCDPVARLAVRSEPLLAAYEKLADEFCKVDPVDGFELVATLSHYHPERVKERYAGFLRGLADGVGLEGRTAYDDGHVVATADGKGVMAKSGPEYPQVADYHRIRATVRLHQLAPEDEEIRSKLEKWAAAHPEEEIRNELREILSGKKGSA
jgi:hypothetical protein